MESSKNGVRIASIAGSVRPDNYTSKALALVLDELRREEVTSELFDPRSLVLDPPGVSGGGGDSGRLRAALSEATGVILATPEYHGSYSSVIKLTIENLGYPSALAGKPVALLGVASGQIGAIKALEHLRSVCAHVGAIVLPGAVSVANVRKVFDEQGRCLDETIESRIRGLGQSLLEYIRMNVCPRVTMEAMVRGE